MFTAYIDESGTEERWCAVAGFIGRATDWDRFEEAWVDVLRSAGVDHFHAKRFFAGARPFQGWSGAKRLSIVDSLTGLITGHKGIALVAAAVDTQAFSARNEQERIYLSGGRWDVKRGRWTLSGAPSRPYYLPLCNILDRCNRSVERVDIVHDQHSVYAEHARRLHAAAKLHRRPERIRAGIGKLTFGSKLEYVPLQAADLAAYLTFCRVAYGKESPDTDIGRASQAFRCFGDRVIVAYDERSIESHLRVALPKAIRDGLMPSQLRTANRRAQGQERQREQQRRR